MIPTPGLRPGGRAGAPVAGRPVPSVRSVRGGGSTGAADAGTVTRLALLNCLLREVSGPAGLVRPDPAGLGHVLAGLPRTGRVLRVAVCRPVIGEPRPTGSVAWAAGGDRSPMTWQELTAVVVDELGAGSSSAVVAEIGASHAFVREVIRRRRASGRPAPAAAGPRRPAPAGVLAGYIASEQSLIAGHRFHPAPKARSGLADEALRYAPETRSAFRLRWFAVPDELVWQREARPGAGPWLESVLTRLSGARPPVGHRLLPVHPWQHAILARGEALPRAERAGLLTDLGEIGTWVRPTSSVRTVTDAGGSIFVKLSLGVQITNCLRLNLRPELAAAVAMTRVLGPMTSELAERFPGTVVLAEPAARTVGVEPAANRRTGDDVGGSGEWFGESLGDELGVIARTGLAGVLRHGVRPVLAAGLAEPWPEPGTGLLLDRLARDRDRLIAWWDAYLGLLVPPVLYAFFEHGVVFEAHLQNVVVGVRDDGDAHPVQLVLRDLEGVKLTGRQHLDAMAAEPAAVRRHLTYSPGGGWDRVAYCLLVNHVSGVLDVLADRDRGAEGALWSRVRRCLLAYGQRFGDPPELRAVLTGAPLPAKANLLTRWHRAADRDSAYVPVRLPLGPGAVGG